MVRFTEKLYTSEKIKSKVGTIKWKTVCGIGMVSVYFITLSLSENDLFDIYSASVFKQRGFRRSDMVILGIADSYEGAVLLIEQMVTECMKATGDVSAIRKYYMDYIEKN